jgi:uncharacterized protein (TIGR02246 family)
VYERRAAGILFPALRQALAVSYINSNNKMNCMRRVIKMTATFCSLLLGQFGFAQTSTDSSEVQKLAENTVSYFYKGDIASFGNLFSSNAIFITVTGVVAKGQSQIMDMHKKWKLDSATTIKYKQPITKFVTNNIAVSYMAWDGLVFGEGPAKGIVQSGYVTLVSQKQREGWKIVSATNALNFTGRKNFDLTPYAPISNK